jgi:hypothetical protein
VGQPTRAGSISICAKTKGRWIRNDNPLANGQQTPAATNANV